jgi:predicted Zn-dependent peptidase
MYRKTVLDNGLRILTMAMPHTRSVGIGIFTAVGSRYENEQQRGISHFIEHMLFKGTELRPTAQQISEAIEGLGGEMNASTGNEVTTYEVKVAHHHLPIALDVLVDMFRCSKFDRKEMSKERRVIIQEIGRAMDMPESWVHSLIASQVWPQHPVGWNIAGTKESVTGISRQQMLTYVAQKYTPKSTIISLAGKLNHDQVVSQIEVSLRDWITTTVPTFLPAQEAKAGPTLHLEFRDTEQAHLCLGLRALPRYHPDRFRLTLLSAVLGGGMSSRLFVEIREKRGLAYDVGCYTRRLRDTGAMILHSGVAPNKARDTISAMIEQMQLLMACPVSPSELDRAREYTKGGILLGMEDTFTNADWVAHQELYDQEVQTVDQVMRKLDEVTAADVQAMARRLFATGRLHLAVVGPFKNEAGFLSRLQM